MRALTPLLATGLTALLASTAVAQEVDTPPVDTPDADVSGADVSDKSFEPSFRLGGYIQPQLLLRQNNAVAQFDENGFRLRRTRLTSTANKPGRLVDVAFKMEAELTPEFQLLDAYVDVRAPLVAGGLLQLDFGQVRSPFSRQSMVSDAEIQFVEKAALTTLTPDRQLGAKATFNVPYAPWLELSAGMFNGEGKNQIQNIDEKFMYIGRIAFRPIGPTAPLVEGAFGEDQLSFAFNAGFNREDVGSFMIDTYYWGGDAFLSWQGISAEVEYLYIQTRPDAPEDSMSALAIDSEAEGVNVQAGYLLPIPGLFYRRFEVGARFEEVDPNDALFIEGPGDVNQSERSYILGLAYYHREHDVKAQLSVAHIQEIEKVDRFMEDATYDNDTILLQVTYRLE